MKFMNNNNEPAKKSSAFRACSMWGFIVMLLVLVFSMFGHYDLQIWANFWPSASNWLGNVFLSDSSTVFYKFSGVWLGFFILFMSLRRLARRGSTS